MALSGTLLALLAVVAGRAALTCGAEVAAMRASATVKSQLRGALVARALDLGPAWLGGQRVGEITALATRGLDGLDSHYARYVPQLVLAVIVPAAVLARVAGADWVSAVIIAGTLPLIAVIAAGAGDRRGPRRARHDTHRPAVGAAELQAFGAQDNALAAVGAADRTLTALARRSAVAAGLGSGLTTAVAGVTLWGVLVLGVTAVAEGTLGRVPLAVLTLTALAAFEAVTVLPAAALQLGAARASATRIAAVLDAPGPVADPPDPASRTPAPNRPKRPVLPVLPTRLTRPTRPAAPTRPTASMFRRCC